MKHLSDDQIQALIDENNADDNRHLAECLKCRDEYDFYMTLASEMEQLEVPQLSTQFSDNIMMKIKERPQSAAESSLSTLLYSLGGVVLAAAVIVYLYGYQNIATYFNNLSLTSFITDSNIVISLKDVITANSGLAGILFFAFITVCFFLTLEQIVVRKKSNRLTMFVA